MRIIFLTDNEHFRRGSATHEKKAKNSIVYIFVHKRFSYDLETITREPKKKGTRIRSNMIGLANVGKRGRLFTGFANTQSRVY